VSAQGKRQKPKEVKASSRLYMTALRALMGPLQPDHHSKVPPLGMVAMVTKRYMSFGGSKLHSGPSILRESPGKWGVEVQLRRRALARHEQGPGFHPQH
jgi:hypothetical protein